MSASAGVSAQPFALRFVPGFRQVADECHALKSELAFLQGQLTRLRQRSGIPAESAASPWDGSGQVWPRLKSDAASSAPCRICGALAIERMRLPRGKRPYCSIPDEPSDCRFLECTRCHFLFTPAPDGADTATTYERALWNADDGAQRVPQTLRLATMAATMTGRPLWDLEFLDFGCGPGRFVRSARDDLGLKVWGTDIVAPADPGKWFLPRLDRGFDAILACEVIEQIPDPLQALTMVRKALRPGGVFAFQTAEYAPEVANRDWDYLGPAQGHVSHYSRAALTQMFNALGGMRRMLWNDYGGIQAWQF